MLLGAATEMEMVNLHRAIKHVLARNHQAQRMPHAPGGGLAHPESLGEANREQALVRLQHQPHRFEPHSAVEGDTTLDYEENEVNYGVFEQSMQQSATHPASGAPLPSLPATALPKESAWTDLGPVQEHGRAWAEDHAENRNATVASRAGTDAWCCSESEMEVSSRKGCGNRQTYADDWFAIGACSSAAGIGFKLVAGKKAAVRARARFRMAVFEARDFGKLKGLAYGHDADVLAAALSLHADFNNAAKIALSHDDSPVLFCFPFDPELDTPKLL